MEDATSPSPLPARQRIGLVLGPLLLVAVLLFPVPERPSPTGWCAGSTRR